MSDTQLAYTDQGTFTPKELAFVEWLAAPKDERPLQQELAKQLHLSARTLRRWQERPELQAAAAVAAATYVVKYAPEAVHLLIYWARRGSWKHNEAILQMAGLLPKDEPIQDNRTQVIILNGPDTTARPWFDAASGTDADHAGAQPLQRGGLWSALGKNGNGHGPTHSNGHDAE